MVASKKVLEKVESLRLKPLDLHLKIALLKHLLNSFIDSPLSIDIFEMVVKACRWARGSVGHMRRSMSL